MNHTDAPTIEMRRRIYQLVLRFPGLHVREIARQLDTSVALVEYHLPSLSSQQLIATTPDDRYIRVFPGPRAEERIRRTDRAIIGALRHPNSVAICLALLEAGPSKHGALTERLQWSKSGLSFHLRRLERAGIVHKRDNAYHLDDPDRIEALMVQYPPTQDLLDRFTDLWRSFYDD